jgi:cellulase
VLRTTPSAWYVVGTIPYRTHTDCWTQNIEVEGSGTESPEGVTADKLYTPTDPGIMVSVYSGDMSAYKMPGPALFSGASSGSDSGSSAAAPTPTVTSAPAATSGPAATSAAVIQHKAVSAAPSSALVASATLAPTTTPAATANAGSALPNEFTLDTFIAWLQTEAGSGAAKVRRHARAFHT